MYIIEILLFGYCIYFVSYALIFAVAGHFYKKPSVSDKSSGHRFAVLIPGYKEDAVICSTVEENLKVNYPKELFEIFVIADSFSNETIQKLQKYPIKVLEVSFDKSTKVKALTRAMEIIPSDYDYVIVLDADNVMETEYLSKVSQAIDVYAPDALQTLRVPKNKNTPLAVLDGISEAINNHIYRQGSSVLRMSPSLNGSGMVFNFDLFKQSISEMESVGGFDRELEYKLLEKRANIRFLREANVFDQKTDNHQNFQSQRKRWISSQYVYLRRFFGKGVKRLFQGDLVYFNSTVWRNIQLPRLINLGLLTIITILVSFFGEYLTIPKYYWIGLWALNAIALFIAIPKSFYNRDMAKSVILLPKLFFSMFLLLFQLKGANKKFIHTQHKTV